MPRTTHLLTTLALALALLGTSEAAGAERAADPGENFATHTSSRTPVLSKVSAGSNHACGIDSTGAGWCWGENRQGSLGDGGEKMTLRPRPIAGEHTWSVLSAGEMLTCGVEVDHTLWCWGRGANGQPDLHNSTRVRPWRVGTASNWRTVEAGYEHACGIRQNGSAWCWGRNGFGQLGTGDDRGTILPVRVGDRTGWRVITVGSYHTCGLRVGGTAWCWGAGFTGQLGTGDTKDLMVPTRLGSRSDWATISAGNEHTCGTLDNGTAFCWGANDGGQLGDGSRTDQLVPTRLRGARDWERVTAGVAHTCGVRSPGTAWCFGRSAFGALGTPLATDQRRPARVGRASDWKVVIAGGHHTCGERSGRVWCWGLNDVGQLGDLTASDRNRPVVVGRSNRAPHEWSRVAGGADRTCAIERDRTLWCAGRVGRWNYDTTIDRRWLMVRVSGESWRTVDVGTLNACAIRTSGTLWCWGSWIGNGTFKLTGSLVRISRFGDWRDVAANGTQSDGPHVCGVRDNGTMWCWGDNGRGQLGIGTQRKALRPVQVGSRTDWASIEVGGSRSCGIRVGGSLWCWGWNPYGAIGDGNASDSNRHRPVRIGTARWRSVAPGRYHTCGVRTNGSLWCWGSQDYVVDSDRESNPRPLRVGTSREWTDVVSGDHHVCALRKDDSVWCWGNGDSGQLGTGTPYGPSRKTPRRVGTATDWQAVATGSFTTCGVRSRARLWCWGSNTAGQLAIGKTGNRHGPVLVPSS